MIDERDLDAAVAAGVLDAGTAKRLVAFARDHRQGEAGGDAEQFRLLTGFNDIFVTIAIGLVLFAVASLAGRVAPVAGTAAAAVACWLLAEYFTRRRRMALPSIVLLLAFVGSVFGAAALLLESGSGSDGVSFGGAGLVAAGAAWVHWQRFRVPITVAAGAAAVSTVVVSAGGLANPGLLLVMVGVCGLAVFALAMWFDASDLGRITRRTDVAFWLHLLAAPMIIHPVFTIAGAIGTAVEAPGVGAGLIVLLYAVLAFVALAIDRRALLVSALGYVIYAVQALVQRGDLGVGFGMTALVIGGVLVLLSAAWRPIRVRVVAVLPVALRERVPVAA